MAAIWCIELLMPTKELKKGDIVVVEAERLYCRAPLQHISVSKFSKENMWLLNEFLPDSVSIM